MESSSCPWFPADGLQDLPMIKWDPISNAFMCAVNRTDLIWRRACVKCVYDILSGETDVCRVAIYGEGTSRTHCNQCRSTWSKDFLSKECISSHKNEPEFGLSNSLLKASSCDNKKKNMIKQSIQECEVEGCSQRATFGISRERTHCNMHKTDDMCSIWRACLRCKKNKATNGKKDRFTHCEDCFKDVTAGIRSRLSHRSSDVMVGLNNNVGQTYQNRTGSDNPNLSFSLSSSVQVKDQANNYTSISNENQNMSACSTSGIYEFASDSIQCSQDRLENGSNDSELFGEVPMARRNNEGILAQMKEETVKLDQSFY